MRQSALITMILTLAALGAAGCSVEATPPPPPPPGVTPAAGGATGGTTGQPIGAGGPMTLSPGFSPDPSRASGTAGGTVSASTLANCGVSGQVAAQPNHLLNLTGNFSNLRIVVNAGALDTTLMVQKPDGTFVCNDDTEGYHPIVAGAFGPGLHKIYVGTFSASSTGPYNLGVTELSSVTAASLGAPPGSEAAGGGPTATGAPGAGAAAAAAAVAAGNSNYGTVSLTPGFTPDPFKGNGTSGGATSAATFSAGCNGYVATQPDHIFTAGGAFGNLRIMAKSTGDITLVVRMPDGTFRCNDDHEGTDPLISGNFPAGTYGIWIGSYQSGTNSPYTIGFSELSSINPSSL